MNTLQSQLVKHRNFLASVRNVINPKQEKTMNAQTEIGISRTTGGNAANKRYKRTTEELLADIEKVDQLVASGRFNQIEALNHVGLQSSVYHYKKRELKEQVAKSLKPRKSAEKGSREEYEMKKQELMQKMEQKTPVKAVEQAPVVQAKANDNSEVARLKAELEAYKAKYAKLCQSVVEEKLLK